MDYSIFSHFRGTLLVGFSGGADSTALLLLATRGAAQSGSEVIAVHFNHHLRGAESDQEAVEAELKTAREDAHKRLEKLKILYAEAKLPIKQSFAPEVWNVFGIPDKR